ncbi:MAG: hypothetical protein CMH30_08650 [Micavibrio sp.]|nr:hypothetical protein [Micavibrio sp.]|tara:strand:+ start:671 stop:1102 length:432 start_codon:yes stop_codon:yes gene_type:complete
MATPTEYTAIAAITAIALVVGGGVATGKIGFGPELELQKNFETAANSLTATGCDFALAFAPQGTNIVFEEDGRKCSVEIEENVDISALAVTLRNRLETKAVVTTLRGETVSFDKTPRISYTLSSETPRIVVRSAPYQIKHIPS